MAEEGTKTASKISRGGEEASDEAVGSGRSHEQSSEEADAVRAATSPSSDQAAGVADVVSSGAKESRTEPVVFTAAGVEEAPSKPAAETSPGSEQAAVVSPGTESSVVPTVPKAAAVETPSKPTAAESGDKEAAARTYTGQRHGESPTNQGTCVECVVFAVVIGVVAVVSVAFFYTAYGWQTPVRVHTMAGGLPKTTVQRGSRVWHGYGPQLLVCTLGDLRPVTAETLPVDGLCDVIVYTHVQSLAGFDEQASPNVRALWTQAKAAKRSRFGYSFARSVLPVQEQELGTFVKTAVQDKSMRVFGMLDARWDNNITNGSYVAFAATLNSTTTRMLPENMRPALMFGVHVTPNTSANSIQFWESHAAVLDHVHVLIYQGHSTRPLGDGYAKPFMITFPSPRFKQVKESEQTMQDSVAAIDTALYFRTHALTSDICVSLTLSAYRFSDTKELEEGEELGTRCGNASLVAYADACVKDSVAQSNASAKEENANAAPIRHAEEGVLVKRRSADMFDTFDDPGTIGKKLRSAKLALSLSAQPYWNFCLAAFNLEHEDSEGACGNRFARLEVARSYLHGKLKWH